MDIEWSDLSSEDKDVELMKLFTSIPNVGMVKAGFIIQLFRGTGGCMDTHNAEIYSPDLAYFHLHSHLSKKTKEQRIREYVRICTKIGSEFLWDRWCEFEAGIYAHQKVWKDAEEVSRYHVKCILRREK